MKKIVYFLILLFIPIFVLADAAGPSIIGYDAIVTNKNGAKVIDTNKVIPYNTKIHIYNEYHNNEETMVEFCVIKNTKEDEECSGGEISIKDIVPLKEEFIPTDKDIKDNNLSIVKLYNNSIIIFEKDGIKLHKGPSSAYKENGSILSYRAKVKPTYAIISYEGESSFYTWYYVSTSEYNGWFYASEYNVAISMPETLVATNTNIYDKDNAIVGTIKSEEVLKNIYYLQKDKNYAYYLEYNGKDGYIKSMDYGYRLTNAKIYTIRDTNIISINGEKRKKVPAATTLEVLYGFEYEEISGIYINEKKGYFYVQFDGVKGFISTNDVETLYSNVKETLVLDYDVEMYDAPSQNAKKLNKVVPSNTQITTPYHYIESVWNENDGKEYHWYLFTYDGVTGWIMTKDVTTKTEKEENKKTNEVKEVIDKKEDQSNKILLYCLIGAGVLCLTSIITIILVNKKKKNKVQETKDNNVDKK